MKKTKLLSLIFLLSFLGLATLILLNANATTIKTTVQASPLGNVQVDQVDHTVKILEGGSVAINDTVKLSAIRNTTLAQYSIGFPYGYKTSLAYVFAFNTSNPSQTFNTSLDTGLGSSIGYYGVTVAFPNGGIQLSADQSLRFTVVFVFSDIISSSTTTAPSETPPYDNVTQPVSTVDFPVFPSLIQNVSLVDVTVITPPNTVYAGSSFPFQYWRGSVDGGQIVNLTSRSLEGLTSAPGWLNFTSSTGSAYRVVTIDDLERHAEVDGQGNIFVTYIYAITSKTPQTVAGILLSLPSGASNVTAYNAQGNSIASTLANENTTTYSVSFGFSLQQGNSTQFKLTYFLPSSNYLNKTGISDFDLNLPITKGLDRVAGKLTFKISLPEGASIKEYPSIKEYGLQKEALQEAILLSAYNVSSYSNLELRMTYVYSVFWASFRPTLWMTTIVAIAVAVALLWQRPKPSLPSLILGVAVKPQTLKSMVSSYEERTKILAELESIERQAQKGKLPRRRYKIRKRMLESQLSRLDRELVDLKQRVKSVGPKYSEILKELDITEAELEGVEAEVKRVEGRYRSGAITLDAYRRLQDQLNKRREKAKTTIDGALLRLSEGIA